MHTRTLVTALLIGLAFIAGCHEANTPWQEDSGLGQHDRHRILLCRTLDPRDGITKKDGAIRLLGEPDRTSPDGRILVYHWMTPDYWRFVVLEFDSADTLKRHLIKRGQSGGRNPDTLDSVLAEWSQPMPTTRP